MDASKPSNCCSRTSRPAPRTLRSGHPRPAHFRPPSCPCMRTTRSASRARCAHTRHQASRRSSVTGTQDTAASPSSTGSRRVARAASRSCRGWLPPSMHSHVPAPRTLWLRLHQQQGISAPLLVQLAPALRRPSPSSCCPTKSRRCSLCPPHKRAPLQTGRRCQDGAPRSHVSWLLLALRRVSPRLLPHVGGRHCLAAWWHQGLPTVSSLQSSPR